MVGKTKIIAGGASLALAITACSGGRPDRPRFEGERLPQRETVFVSPAGKPFRNAQAATPPLAQWFREADTDGDGALRYDELRADFDAAFTLFDLDGDGDIQGPEVIHYEREIFPEISSAIRGGGRGSDARRASSGGGPGQDRGGDRRRSGGRPDAAGRERSGGQGRSRGGGPSGAARFGLLPIHHPIMQADRDIDRRVTREEFQSAADLRFGLLDEDGDGAVSLAQLEQMLEQRREERRRQ